MDLDASFLIGSEEELAGLYDPAIERSVRKQLDHVDEYCREFIAASPFIILATQGDASPRGDAQGFIHVEDEHTLLIPDRRGNNRLDSLRNMVRDPRVGLLFMIPGIRETLRVNGEAALSRDPALTARFVVQEKEPRTVIVVKVKEAYVHCSRALVRADLWNPVKFAPPGAVPSFGAMMQAHTKGFVDGAKLDEENVTRVPMTLY